MTSQHFLLAVSLLAIGACTQSAAGSESELTKEEDSGLGKTDISRDFCEEFDWYGDGVCDDFCLRLDEDCATDARRPELGEDPTVMNTATITMAEGLRASASIGPVIEAKFEVKKGKLLLSTYPVTSVALDAERTTFLELKGDATQPWAPPTETFHDFKHLTRSSRDLTLIQLSQLSLEDAVAEVDPFGTVYWAIPTIQDMRAGYGVWALVDDQPFYSFIDGAGSSAHQTIDLGTGPGPEATDLRVPKLPDPTVVRTAQVSMSTALNQTLEKYPGVIEAKYEIGGDGKLVLSIYPVKEPLSIDAERQTFFELQGDPTAATYVATETKFDVPDEEHVNRSARDLTLVQTQSMSLSDAVTEAESEISGGIVYWAIPTIRDTRSGYGVYVLAPDDSVHYLFIS